MSQGTNLVVHGEVSPSLLQNLAEFQAAWVTWKPNLYRLIDIYAEVEKEPSNHRDLDKVITTFSGGVDSCFTSFNHRSNNSVNVKRNLQTGLMIHGLDIPLEQKEVFNNAVHKSKEILSSLDVDLITMKTNFRQLIKLNWDSVYVNALASCLSLLQRGYTVGLIPSGSYYKQLSVFNASNPVTDNLLSSNSFRIIHDGAAFTRIDKIRAITNSAEILQNLRVCWQGEQKDRNCCRCEKCIRNILCFRVLGRDLPPCFAQDVTDNQILHIQAQGVPLEALEEILIEAKSIGISDNWVQVLEQAIKRNRLKILLKQYVPNNIRKKLQPLKKIFAK
ncbi:hypothetical protein FD725_20085 [Nostoc sp. TCL26-01]|nr:hypothetical protein FD725_20085 [Nostoc sp. TCL26-01]